MSQSPGSITSTDALEEALSRPTEPLLEEFRKIDGDIIVLGAGGKMGPTLARMARRAADSVGKSIRVIAVSRFSNEASAELLRNHGVETIACDLLDHDSVAALPDAPNVIFMAGQKFGTMDTPELTWVMNTLVPANVAQRYSTSQTVVFSTGCVYPLAPVESSGAKETDPLEPPGEYANSCVGRERIFTHFAKENRTPTLLFRLSYAIDLRYGVLHDVARKVFSGEPVDVSMGYANVIWQGDANARAIQALAHVSCPPLPLNVTGLDRVSIRELANRFGELFNREPTITGQEGSHAWLFNAERSYELFGPPSVSLDEMIQAVAEWIRNGGSSLGKPTHFESRDGRF